MRLSIIIALFLTIPILGLSQVYKGSKADELIKGANNIRIKPYTKVPDYLSYTEAFRPGTEKAEDLVKTFFENRELSIREIERFNDKLGWEHFRYTQTYNGIDIEFTQYIVHTKDGKLLSMNGSAFSSPIVKGAFNLSGEEAVSAALKFVNAEKYIFEADASEKIEGFSAYEKPIAEKVYFPKDIDLSNNEIIAAYKVDVYSLKPYDRKWVYINAENGQVIQTVSRIQTTDVPGTAVTAYSGNQTITTDFTGSSYRLRESGRGNGVSTYNCQLTTNYNTAIDFTDSDNMWNNVNANLDQYATDAHFATERTYDYYYNVHGRNSINNSGFHLKSYVHFNLVDAGYSNNVNAFWNGDCMTYGDGDDTRTPLSTVDICGHEITHGLTSYTANLVYQNESGALNEAFSDIFGTVIEYYAAPAYFDWTIGEDISYPFRSLSYPKDFGLPDTYLGEFWYTDSGDNGGVHRNCGPLTYWFYLISEGGSGNNDLSHPYNITGIGIENAADIAYRMLTVYLTNTSNYADARYYGIQAAIDFYGACSDEVGQITNSYYAIGVGEAFVPDVIASFTSDYNQNCTAPFTIHFYNNSMNGNNFTWHFGDGATSSEVNPTHTYTSTGSFDVSLLVDGEPCGSDEIIEEDYIQINPQFPCLIFMPSSGNVTTNQCSGILYDIGGPDNPYYDNTYASYVIQPAGATKIILNINEFDIEPGESGTCNYDYIAFYDGTNTSAPLINDTYYCNNTGNPGTIESTGGALTIVFSTDPGLSLQGFEIEWNCLQDNGSPLAAFSSENQSSCNGYVQFTNESLNNPVSYAWDFGDGSNSTEENPLHLYMQNGSYTVVLSVVNPYGSDTETKFDFVNVSMDESPALSDVDVCIDSLFTLGSESNGDLHWYSDENCTNLVHTGAEWDHAPIGSNISYWIRSFDIAESYYIGETQSNVGGGYFGNPAYIHYLVFDAYKPFTLLSAEINADGDGERQFALRDAESNTIETKTIFCYNGTHRVNLNFNVPIGESLQLVGLNSPNLYRTNEAAYLNYPYSISDVCTIKYSSASQSPTGYYYYFYDWEIYAQACESEPDLINISAVNCNTNIASNIGNEGISIYPHPAGDIVYFSGFNEAENYFVTVLNSNGVSVSGRLPIQNNQMNVSRFANGLYILKIETVRGFIYLKLIKS